MRNTLKLIATALIASLSLVANAQPTDPYELPDPLKMEDGRVVRSKRQWVKELSLIHI